MKTRRVEILETTEVFRKFFFRIEEARLRFEQYDGTMSEEITRLSFERGDSAAVILHNPVDDTLILTEQFRYPTYQKAGGWVMEIVAGVIEESDANATTSMQREILEETGHDAPILRPVHTFFLSPGGSSERIYLFYAALHPRSKIAMGGGLARENEDIRTVTLTVDEALQKLSAGDFMDAKTIIGLQWLQLNRNKLPSKTTQ